MKNSKLIVCVLLGVVFWFNGAMTVKLLGNYVFTESSPYKFIMFLTLFPTIYVFFLICRKIANIQKSEMLKAVVIMTITASFCDEIAFIQFRQIYSESYEVSHYGAAWILTGVGVGLLIAWLMNDENEHLISPTRK
jgi:Family of unknown function (DUF5367)